MKKDIRELIKNIQKVVDRHKLAEGAYSRWTFDNGTGRNMGINEYGCADAANILYTIGAFPRDVEERKEWVRVLQSLQDPETGLYTEATHYQLHTTAHCAGALELFDALPKYRLAALDPYRTKDGLYQFLEELEWEEDPWDASHKGAGLYAALYNANELDPEWADWYFGWLWEEADPATGMWRKGFALNGVREDFHHLAGTFHYLFNHEHTKMPIRYPDKMIDTCLEMHRNGGTRPTFGKSIGFSEIDWVFCITRALRQCNHRFEESVEMITEFADSYLDYLMSLDPDTDERMDDLHALFGAVCCVAELQRFLPGSVITEKPLKLVLDRRPFI